jgi:hypothetical protein
MAAEAVPRKLDERIEFFRKRVRVDVSYEGILDDAPMTIVERFAERHGLHLGPMVIRVNEDPKDAPLWAFCGSALVFLFFLSGYFGMSRYEAASAAEERTAEAARSEEASASELFRPPEESAGAAG